MPTVKPGSTVRVHLTAQLKNGETVYSTSGEDPMRLTLGQGAVMKGVEEELLGMSQGEVKTVTIPASKAYGKRDESRVTHLGEPHPHLGHKPVPHSMQSFTDQQGREVVLRFGDAEGRITIDANSPLAGVDLLVSIEVVEIIS